MKRHMVMFLLRLRNFLSYFFYYPKALNIVGTY